MLIAVQYQTRECHIQMTHIRFPFLLTLLMWKRTDIFERHVTGRWYKESQIAQPFGQRKDGICYESGKRISDLMHHQLPKMATCTRHNSERGAKAITKVNEKVKWPYSKCGLTLRLLMSYIYGAPILDVSRSHTTTHHSR